MLTELERAVLDMLLAGETPALAILRQQLDQAAVQSREFSGVGFFTHFTIPPAVPRLPLSDRLIFGAVEAELNSLAHGAGFVLFVEDGKLSMLEGYTYDEPWPESLGPFRLRYHHAERQIPPELTAGNHT